MNVKFRLPFLIISGAGFVQDLINRLVRFFISHFFFVTSFLVVTFYCREAVSCTPTKDFHSSLEEKYDAFATIRVPENKCS